MDAHENAHESAVEVELRGLSIYTHHGVTDAEQEVGQRLEIDVSFDVQDGAALSRQDISNAALDSDRGLSDLKPQRICNEGAVTQPHSPNEVRHGQVPGWELCLGGLKHRFSIISRRVKRSLH